MVAITGVSGSGKSTLVHDVIYKALDGVVQQSARAANEDDARRRKSATWRRVVEARHCCRKSCWWINRPSAARRVRIR